MHFERLSSQYWGIFFFLLGCCFALATYLILRSGQSMKKLIIGLSRIGPCTGLALAKAGYASRGTVYVDLQVAMDRGLVRRRPLVLSDERKAIRGNIPEYEYRLTTKGWSLATAYKNDE